MSSRTQMAAPVGSARASSSSSGVQPSQFERQAQPSVLGGMLMANFGGYAHVAMIISCIYIRLRGHSAVAGDEGRYVARQGRDRLIARQLD